MRLKNTNIKSEIKLAENEGVNKWVQVLRVGKFQHPQYGAFEITPKVLSEMKQNFDNKVRGIDIAFDYFHKSDEEASGWPTKLELRENNTELWAETDWTPTAAKKLSDRELRYFSPDFSFKWTDPESGKTFNNVLFGGALTNRPFVKEMEAIVASEETLKTQNILLGGPGSGRHAGGGAPKPSAGAQRAMANNAKANQKGAAERKKAEAKSKDQQAKTDKVLGVANQVEKAGAGHFSRQGNDLHIYIPVGRGSASEQKAIANLDQVKKGLGNHVSESKFDPTSGSFKVTVKDAYSTKLAELLLNRTIKLQEQGEYKMDEKDKMIAELQAKVAELEAKIQDMGANPEADDQMQKMMADQAAMKADNEKMLSEIAALKEEKAKADQAKALAEKESAFNVLLSEGKACKAQKDAFIKGDMNEFIKLSQPVNLKGHGVSGSGDEGDVDATAIIKLAEEKQKANPKLSRGDAISMAKKELKK